MRQRWPRAQFREDAARAARLARRSSIQAVETRPPSARRDDRHRFEVRVGDPAENSHGPRHHISNVATKIHTPRARAVGAAVGKNPIAFVVPCHRVIGRRDLTGYYWG